MTSFGRFLLVFGLVVLALCLFGGGPLSIFGMIGTAIGLGFSIVATVLGAIFAAVFGLIGLAFGMVALVPLLIPFLIVAAPILLLVGLLALVARTARG